MVSKRRNQGPCQITPDYPHDFASGPAVEIQLSWLFLNIPNYSYYAHNPSRSNGHSSGNQLPQKRAIACRGPDDHCPLRFRIGQRIPGRRWKESVLLCCLCLSALLFGIIRIMKIIMIIGTLEIISKIFPEHQALAPLGAALRDGWTPRAPLGSSLPVHDEIPIPDLCMPQANVSEAESQKQLSQREKLHGKKPRILKVENVNTNH